LATSPAILPVLPPLPSCSVPRGAARSAVGDHAGDLRREVVQADHELPRAKKTGAGALDRAGGHAGGREAGHVEDAAAVRYEARVAPAPAKLIMPPALVVMRALPALLEP
jgi:hypothetical protein